MTETALQLGMFALERAADAHRPLVERLAVVARELAAAGNAITVADVREAAVKRGILTGLERGRALSFLGAVMKHAGLRPLESYRRSHLDVTHGNLNREWAL